MATQIVPENSQVDVDCVANEAAAIADALDWIVQAKDLIDSIRHFVQFDAVLGEKFKQYDIRANSPEWLGMADSITYLSLRQRELIRVLGSVARGASHG